jgi:formylglycine-generating enzyme required for sulfatase activity
MVGFQGVSGIFCIDQYEFPNERAAMPVSDVRQPEAATHCAGRGKRLCTAMEWEQACRGPTGTAFPYGNTFVDANCHTAELINAGPAGAGTHLECRGNQMLFDMSGNVAEWIASPGGSSVQARGGDWSSVDAAASCSAVRTLGATQSHRTIGFRCCKDAAR